MFSNVLVPADLTERNRKAADVALELAREGASVTFLHVIETIEHIPVSDLKSFYDRLRVKALEGLDDLASSFRLEDLPVSIDVIMGKRLDSIIAYGTDNGFDLIVLSSHPIDADRPGAGLGTISYKVAILAPCAVLLVK